MDSHADPVRAARDKRLAEALRANLRRRKGAGQPPSGEKTAGAPESRPESDENESAGR